MYVTVIGCYSPDNLLLSRFTCFLVTLCSISIPESFLSKSLTWSAWEERGGREDRERSVILLMGGGVERAMFFASSSFYKVGEARSISYIIPKFKFRVTVE